MAHKLAWYIIAESWNPQTVLFITCRSCPHPRIMLCCFPDVEWKSLPVINISFFTPSHSFRTSTASAYTLKPCTQILAQAWGTDKEPLNEELFLCWRSDYVLNRGSFYFMIKTAQDLFICLITERVIFFKAIWKTLKVKIQRKIHIFGKFYYCYYYYFNLFSLA